MNTLTATLRELRIGESVLFAQYTSTKQVASAVQRLRQAEGMLFTTAAEPPIGVRITRQPGAGQSDPLAGLL